MRMHGVITCGIKSNMHLGDDVEANITSGKSAMSSTMKLCNL